MLSCKSQSRQNRPCCQKIIHLLYIHSCQLELTSRITILLGDYPRDIPLIQYDNGPLEPVYWETELTNSLSVNLKLGLTKGWIAIKPDTVLKRWRHSAENFFWTPNVTKLLNFVLLFFLTETGSLIFVFPPLLCKFYAKDANTIINLTTRGGRQDNFQRNWKEPLSST